VVLPISGRGFLVCDDQRREFQSRRVLEDLSYIACIYFQQYIHISNTSDTCLIQQNAQVDAYSGAMVVCQPNNGPVNNDLEVVEIVDTDCHVKVARADGQILCLSFTTGAHVHFDPVIVIACINDLIDQGSTNRTVCRHKAFNHRIYNRGKISCLVSQSVMSIVTNVMWDLAPQLVHTFLTKWNTSMMTTSTMMLGLVSDGKYWIDVLNKEVEYPLKGIFSLWGEYEHSSIP
jgi:hypothetical protein